MNNAERARSRRALIGLILLGLTALTVTASVLLFACGEGMYKQFVARPELSPEDDPLADKSFSEERMAWRAEYAGEQWTVKTTDGLTLAADYIRPPAEESHAWVVLVSGIQGRELYLEDLTIELHKRGCNVLLAHLRGYGPSEGRALGLGYLDKPDILSWVRQIEKTDPEARIVLYGFSQGASAILMAAPEVPPLVAGVISDSAFTRFDKEVSHLLREGYHLPVFPLQLAGDLACRRRAGFWFSDCDPLTAVAGARAPILFFHGGADDYVPPSMAASLYAAAPGKESIEGAAGDKTLLVVPNAAHCRALDTDPEAYWSLLDSFLRRRLKLPEAPA